MILVIGWLFLGILIYLINARFYFLDQTKDQARKYFFQPFLFIVFACTFWTSPSYAQGALGSILGGVVGAVGGAIGNGTQQQNRSANQQWIEYGNKLHQQDVERQQNQASAEDYQAAMPAI